MDSSTAEAPSTTTPSAATFSPGLTTMMSPGRISPMGTSASPPSLNTLAVRAWSPMSLFIDSVVRPLALASRSLPRRISVIMVAAESK